MSENETTATPRRRETEALVNVVQRTLAAYGTQRDDVGDSDLDNEQPIVLMVRMTLGDLRRARIAISALGHFPADFKVRPR